MTQAQALALSLAVEVPVAWALARGAGLVPRKRLWRLALCAVAVTLVSHPAAWASFGWLARWLAWLPRVVLIEVAVVVVEAALYAWLVPLARRRALVLSLVANTASFAVGLLIQRVG